ncbi:MAG: MFS transporter, partial [Alphaproteobacteria bacterium]|nr:MFS transporter [Alphaproteobacteria bacterium]
MATVAADQAVADTIADTGTINLKRDLQVILASSLGTVFEWYDFFVYITVAQIIATTYFPASSPTAGLLNVLLIYGAGFGMRPFGAAFFGVLGDRLGRKFTFLITISLMGLATAALGFVPSYARIGIAAPFILVGLRLLQGLALGGEYGGAAIYVAEHAPREKRGLYTSFIQASVVGGLILSLALVLLTTRIIGMAAWNSWGWRIPFWLSILLLAISLWVRFQLKESPIFQAMKAAEQISGNPLRESFSSARKCGRILAAMMGVAAGLTVIWYTAQLYALSFLQFSLRLDDVSAWLLILAGAVISLAWFILFGWLSDKWGRKIPILVGYGLTLFALFPLFHLMADGANPSLANALRTSPIIVTGSNCQYNPFA